jgi:hypothetical protein
MIITARQLEQLARAGGPVVLPFQARLSPLAADLVRAKKILVRFDVIAPAEVTQKLKSAPSAKPLPQTGRFAWWCSGACGQVKAALTMLGRELPISPLAVLADASRPIAAVREIARLMRDESLTGAVLAVEHAGETLVLANRCRRIRAIGAASVSAIDAARASVAPNVLVLEHTKLSLAQARSLVDRFVRLYEPPTDAITRELAELESL